MAERAGDWMITVTGRRFWPLDPHPEDVHMDDLAHALAKKERWGGMAVLPCSVAAHSIRVGLVAGFLADRAKPAAGGLNVLAVLHGLLHDAHEAYLPDFLSPLSRSLPKEERDLWRLRAAAVDLAIHKALGAPNPAPVSDFVHQADQAVLAYEASCVLSQASRDTLEREARHLQKLEALDPELREFLHMTHSWQLKHVAPGIATAEMAMWRELVAKNYARVVMVAGPK